MTGLNKPVSDEQMDRLDGKYKAIQRKLGAGALPFEQVLGSFQSIHDGKFGDTAPPVTHQRVRKIQLIHGKFVPPEVQIENVKRWNEEEQEQELWFSDEVFDALPQPPAWPDEKLAVVVLVPYKPTIQGTFDGLWGIAASRQKNQWRWPDLRSDPDHLRLMQGIGHQPGLRWEVIYLAANWDKKDGTSPESVRSAESSPHAGILAAAAHHPKWVQAMDGVNVPYVWIPGYEASVVGDVEWRNVPRLSFTRDARGIRLFANACGARDCRWSVPAFAGSAA